MSNSTKKIDSLIKTIVDGINDVKGENIVLINLNKIENSVCKHFIICSANSNTQVAAIADSIVEKMKEEQNERVWKKEGLDNAQWILLDYVDIVVHVFQTEYREFYKLEQLWADAEIKVLG